MEGKTSGGEHRGEDKWWGVWRGRQVLGSMEGSTS